MHEPHSLLVVNYGPSVCSQFCGYHTHLCRLLMEPRQRLLPSLPICDGDSHCRFKTQYDPCWSRKSHRHFATQCNWEQSSPRRLTATSSRLCWGLSGAIVDTRETQKKGRKQGMAQSRSNMEAYAEGERGCRYRAATQHLPVADSSETESHF